MKTAFNFISDRLYSLAREDRGAEGLEKLLIVAAIVLPLLGVLLFFKGAISDWVNKSWGDVAANPNATNGNTDPFTGGPGN